MVINDEGVVVSRIRGVPSALWHFGTSFPCGVRFFLSPQTVIQRNSFGECNDAGRESRRVPDAAWHRTLSISARYSSVCMKPDRCAFFRRTFGLVSGGALKEGLLTPSSCSTMRSAVETSATSCRLRQRAAAARRAAARRTSRGTQSADVSRPGSERRRASKAP